MLPHRQRLNMFLVVVSTRRAITVECSLLTCSSHLSVAAIFKGTVNDPTTFPKPSRTHGSYHWAFERLLSASLVPVTAAAVVTTGSHYPFIDGLLGITLIMHSHIGVSLQRPSFLSLLFALLLSLSFSLECKECCLDSASLFISALHALA